MSVQKGAVQGGNDFDDDFDDDDTFLNLNDDELMAQGNNSQASEPIIIEDLDKDKGGADLGSTTSEQRRDSLVSQTDSVCFLSGTPASSVAFFDTPLKPTGKPQIYAPAPGVTATKPSSQKSPSSNFNLTPDFNDSEDEDDELFANIDLDLTVDKYNQEKGSPALAASSGPTDKSNDLNASVRAESSGLGPSFVTVKRLAAAVTTPVRTKSPRGGGDTTTSFRNSTSTLDRSNLRASTGSSRKSPPSVRRQSRRFPGPAGLLPSLKPAEFSVLDSPKNANPLSRRIDKIISDHQNPLPASPSQLSCSQEDKTVFERLAWLELLDQLKLGPEDDGSAAGNVLKLMNIHWLRTKGTRLPGCRKIPFLAAVVHEAPELINGKIGKFKAPCVTLADPTGTIDAAVDANFLTVYANELIPGTALALKDVGLLQFKRHMILTITERNVICMTSTAEGEDRDRAPLVRDRRSKARRVFLTSQDVRVTEFCDFIPANVMESYYRMSLPIENEDYDDEEGLGEAGQRLRPVNLFPPPPAPVPSGFSSNRGLEPVTPRQPVLGFTSNRGLDPQAGRTSTNSDKDRNANTTATTAESDFGDDDDEFIQALGDTDFLDGLDDF